MQAIPSTTPLSRTAFWTSSVMSLTVRPPAVRRRVSCWNTFIIVAILRESLPDSAVEASHPQWILRESLGLNSAADPSIIAPDGCQSRRRGQSGLGLWSELADETGTAGNDNRSGGGPRCIGT